MVNDILSFCYFVLFCPAAADSDSTIAVTTSSPTLNTTASFVQPDTTPATSAISSTIAVTSAGSATTVTRLVESRTLRSDITSTEETSTSESISSVTGIHSTTNTEPHASPIMVSASTKDSLVASKFAFLCFCYDLRTLVSHILNLQPSYLVIILLYVYFQSVFCIKLEFTVIWLS